jgi:histidine triad (HIT) family protein
MERGCPHPRGECLKDRIARKWASALFPLGYFERALSPGGFKQFGIYSRLSWITFWAATFSVMSKTLFEKIIAREIPSDIVYEDDLVLAFRDIKPQAPVHVLIVPKKPVPRVAEATAEDHRLLGHLLLKAAEVAAQLGLKQSGYRLVINNGPDGGESVPHLHCHILGGRHMNWPPG